MNTFLKERIIHIKKTINVSITFLIYSFALGLIVPIFNIRINEITNSIIITSIVFMIANFTKALLDLPAGHLINKVSPKKVLIASLITQSITIFNYSIINSVSSLIINTVIYSAAGTGVWISGWIIIRNKTRDKNAQEEISAWIIPQAIAYLIAPIIGGLIISWEWRIAYYLTTIIMIASSISVIRIKNNHKISNIKILTTIKRFFKSKQLRYLSALTMLNVIIISTFSSFLTLKLENIGLTISQISIIMSIGLITPYIILPAPISVISDKHGRKQITIIGLILMSIGLILITRNNDYLQVLVDTLIINTGAVMITTSYNAELNDLTPKKMINNYTGIFETIKDFGAALGPVITIMTNSINLTYLALSVLSISSVFLTTKLKDY